MMREAASNGTESLNNRPPWSHWRPICLPPRRRRPSLLDPKSTRTTRALLGLGRPIILQPAMAGKQTRGLSKRDYRRHIEEFHNVRGRPDAVRFRDCTGIAKCDVSAT